MVRKAKGYLEVLSKDADDGYNAGLCFVELLGL